LYYYSRIRLILIYRPLEGGRLSRTRLDIGLCDRHATTEITQKENFAVLHWTNIFKRLRW